MPSFGLSTWSLHRTLGVAFTDSPGKKRSDVPEPRWGAARLELLDLPAELRRRGLTDLQICHFHFPSRSPAYLAELSGRIHSAGVTLDALLIDDGDLTDPLDAARDRDFLAGWIDTAAELGARHVRLIAGKQQPSPQRLEQSATHLLTLAGHARGRGVKVVIENWMALLPSPVELLDLLTRTSGQVGLCFDFGNWSGPTKYDHLSRIAAHAVTAHAKCGFAGSRQPDAADFQRCCGILRSAGFSGTLALIYDGPDPDEWAHLEIERVLAAACFTCEPT
jgi:sugar phosphate isomerase/epimerase